jgi:hypothetical protein
MWNARNAGKLLRKSISLLLDELEHSQLFNARYEDELLRARIECAPRFCHGGAFFLDLSVSLLHKASNFVVVQA